MPSLFLSPSVQEYNPYIAGLGSEEYYMNLIADAMEPYLYASGITFTRTNPDDTVAQAIALSNAGNYDFYPNPNIVRTIPNTTLGELRLTRAPANLIELAYHDNLEDALWIANNVETIARNLVLSLTEYFGIPFVEPF